MKSTFHNAVTLLAVVGAVAIAPAASAQSAGQYTVKVGANKITPQVESGDVSAPALPGTKAAVGADTEPVLMVAYGLTDNISAEIDMGLPYKHKFYGAGAVQGLGQIGSVQSLPPTAFIQYRFFEPKAMFRPYVGLGATYAYFQKESGSGALTATTNIGGQPTTFKVKNKLAATLQAGVAVNLSERWFVDATYTKTYLKTQVNFSTGQFQDMTLNPKSVSLAVGYKF
jgi:outer membrane protein